MQLAVMTDEQLDLTIDLAIEYKWSGSGDYIHRHRDITVKVSYDKKKVVVSGAMDNDEDGAEGLYE